MSYIADFHIHSKYSRATSKDMELASLVKWAKIKGVAMLGTGDFTHPAWFSELQDNLQDAGGGVYKYDGIDFILTTEVSNIYFKAGRTRKVHNMIFAPTFKAADEINSVLSQYSDLASDGRPILGLDCARMVKELSAIDPGIFFVPAHAWTPHFSIFGSNSGFDSPEECFEAELDKIFSIETGLSSDPKMNWRWAKLDRFCFMSNSDAHSPSKIGREANVFNSRIDYNALIDILKHKDGSRFLYTVEFFPEEGKYHWDGHRDCKTRLSPEEAMSTNNLCPVCGKKVTIGVMHRLEAIADREEGYADTKGPQYKSMVPLAEIIGGCMGFGADSITVEKEYNKLIQNFGNEFRILLEAPEEELKQRCQAKIANGIINVRKGNLDIKPGYDGEYGKISIINSPDETTDKQLSFL